MILNFIKKKKKILLASFVALFCLSVLLLAAFPFILSKGLLCKQINKQIKGKLTIRKASLSWFRPQKFENIVLVDPTGKSVIEIQTLTTSATLLDLFLDRKDLKETKISGLEGYLLVPKDKPSNITASLDSSVFIAEKESLGKKSSVFIFKIPFTGQFHVDNSKLVVKSLDQAPIYFQDIQFNCKLPGNAESLTAHLVCETFQNDLSGSMHLNIEMGGFDKKGQLIFTPLDRDIFFLSPDGYLNLNAEITNLPSAGLDHLFNLYNPKLKNLFSNAAGGSITCGAHLHVVKNKSKVNLTAHSNDIDLRFSGTIQQNQFFLSEPSTCRLHIKPLFINNLANIIAPGSNLTIEQSADALLQIDRMTMPLDFKNFNFSNLSCNAQLSLAPMKFLGGDKVQNFEIKQIKGTIDTFDLNESVTLHLNATAYNDNNPVHFKLDGQLSKLIDSQKELKGFDQIKAHFIAQAKDVPTSFALHFTKEKALALEVLGPSINLDTTFKGSLSAADITMNLNSSRMQIPNLALTLKDKSHLTLAAPSKVSVRVTPSLAKKMFASKFSLLQPIGLNGDLTSCEFEIKNNKLALNVLDLGLHTSSFDFFIPHYKPCHTTNTFAHFSRTHTSELSAELVTEIVLPQDMPFHSLDKTFKAHLHMTDFASYVCGNPTLLQTNLDSQNWNVSFNGYLDKKWNFDLLQEATATLTSPEFYREGKKIADSSKLTLNVNPCTFNFLNLDIAKMNLSGSLFMETLNLQSDQLAQSFEAVKIPFEYSGAADFLNLSITSAKKLLDVKLTCQSLVSSKGFDLTNAKYKLFADLKGISPNILQAITTSQHDYESILGPCVDFHVQSNFTKSEHFKGELQYELSSSILHSKGDLIFGKNIQLADSGLHFDYFMSPASYVAINKMLKETKEAELILDEPLTLKLQIKRLNKSLHSSLKDSPLAFDGNLSIDKFVTNKGSLFDLSGNFNTSNILTNLKIDLSAKTHNDKLEEGMALLSGELTNPFSFESGGINSKINGFMNCKLLNFPTAFLSDFIPFKSDEMNTLTHLLGLSFDMNCSLALTSGKGPLKFEVKSKKLSSSFSLNFDKDHLYLEDDLKANFKLDHENIGIWLKNINPLFTSFTGVDTSAKMVISKENFYIPLSPFRLSQIQIETARIDLDKISLKKSNLYSKLLLFLKSQSKSDEVTVWFTPTYFSLKKGLLQTHRTDFLLNNEFHLALWGDYDLKHKKGRYFLSLPQDTLKQAFGFKKLPPNYMFQIPLTGSIHSLKIDWATAAAQLGILGLSSSFTAPAAGGNQNTVAGLDQILDTFAQSQPSGYPPMPLSAFPWEQDKSIARLESKKAPSKKEASAEEQTAILQGFFKELRKIIRE